MGISRYWILVFSDGLDDGRRFGKTYAKIKIQWIIGEIYYRMSYYSPGVYEREIDFT